jgi:hypothetical protein
MAFGDFTVARTSVKHVLNASGVLASVAADTPAFEFNADGTYRGLLVEPAGTNLILQSEDFTTTWSNNGSTDTANTTVAPDGATTADTVTGNGTDTTVYVQQNITFAGAGTYTFSCWAKAGTHDIIRVNIANYAGSTSDITGYDLTNGTTTQATNPIVAYPNGWYRISFTFTVAGGDLDGSIRIFLSPSTGTTAWTLAADSDTKSVILWGAQLETGSVATSYIPTVASTATRTADSVSLTGASSLIGQTEGTLFVEAIFTNVAGSSFARVLECFTGANDRISIVINASTARGFITTASVDTQGGTMSESVANNTIYRIALAYAVGASQGAFYVNGTGDITSPTAIPATASINIGQSIVGGVVPQWIRAVALYPTRLSNAQLAVLTTL